MANLLIEENNKLLQTDPKVHILLDEIILSEWSQKSIIAILMRVAIITDYKFAICLVAPAK